MIGYDNITNATRDPISFSITGVSIVFLGLLIISLAIFLLPKVLNLLAMVGTKKVKQNFAEKERVGEEKTEDEKELSVPPCVPKRVEM